MLTARDKYVELDTGEREYYDVVADPYELRSQIADPACSAPTWIDAHQSGRCSTRRSSVRSWTCSLM